MLQELFPDCHLNDPVDKELGIRIEVGTDALAHDLPDRRFTELYPRTERTKLVSKRRIYLYSSVTLFYFGAQR